MNITEQIQHINHVCSTFDSVGRDKSNKEDRIWLTRALAETPQPVEHKHRSYAVRCYNAWSQGNEGMALHNYKGLIALFNYKSEQHPAPPVPEETTNETEGDTTMNLYTASLLVRDDITTCTVRFEPSYRTPYQEYEAGGSQSYNGIDVSEAYDKDYIYILHQDLGVRVGDLVVVHAAGSPKVAVVTAIRQEPDLDPNKSTNLKWVLARFETDAMHAEQGRTQEILSRLKARQRASTREQVLQQFGVGSMQELLDGPQGD